MKISKLFNYNEIDETPSLKNNLLLDENVYNGPVLNSYEARFIQTFPQEQDKNISS
jgi:hypothetical protein